MTKEQFEGWLKARIRATQKAQKKWDRGSQKYIALGGKLTALKSVLDFARAHD